MNLEIKTNDKRLLVDGEFTNDSVIHTIKLYCSGSLITGQPQTVVTGAKIYITDKTDTFDYIENRDTLGLYQTSGKCCGKGGRNYFLSITNIDIDKDGEMDSYTTNSLLPVPVTFDSLVSYRGFNGDGAAVINLAYYKLYYNGPDYVYSFVSINNESILTITDRLGSGELTRFINEVPKVLNPGSVINYNSYFAIVFSENPTLAKGDTISFIVV